MARLFFSGMWWIVALAAVPPSSGTEPRGDLIQPAITQSAAKTSARAPALPVIRGERETRRAEDGLFYLTALVNHVPVRFVVDTGASVVVLTRADAARARLASRDHVVAAVLDTASGGARMAWTTLPRLHVGGRELTGLRAAVAHDGLKVSLLGQNALAKLGTISFDGDYLRIRSIRSVPSEHDSAA